MNLYLVKEKERYLIENNLQELFAERREKNRLRKMIEDGSISDEEYEEYVNRNPYSRDNE